MGCLNRYVLVVQTSLNNSLSPSSPPDEQSFIWRGYYSLLLCLILNEEFLVNANHQFALITSLPFVHTARRTYRLNGPVKRWDCGWVPLLEPDRENFSKPYHLEEGEVVTRFP